MYKNWMIQSILFGGTTVALGQEAAEAFQNVQIDPAKLKEITEALSTANAALAEAKAASAAAANSLFVGNNIWMLLATVLVFIMHLGFACIEVGLTRAKNTVNILFKNVSIVAIGIVSYAVIGFALMYPGTNEGGWFGLGDMWLNNPEGAAGLIEYAEGGYTYWSDFIFQGMFAATAATIVSGAVAERIKLGPFMVFSAIFVAIIYPMLGMWQWGGGWAAVAGFHDFAGSTLVHSVGGWGALAGVIVLGPRLGKYLANGQIRPIMGHNMPLATMGMFLLWFGWYGFNGGSVLSADPGIVSLVFVTTSLGACAGIFGAMIAAWIFTKTPDLSMILNGALAGLVGITAGADVISPVEAIIIGGVAGALVYLSVVAFDRIRIDDPVGAISVHLVCGIWGTLAAGIFGEGKDVFIQAKVIAIYAVGAFIPALIIFVALKYTLGIRVSREEELGGLDRGEHKAEAYNGFQIFNN